MVKDEDITQPPSEKPPSSSKKSTPEKGEWIHSYKASDEDIALEAAQEAPDLKVSRREGLS